MQTEASFIRISILAEAKRSKKAEKKKADTPRGVAGWSKGLRDLIPARGFARYFVYSSYESRKSCVTKSRFLSRSSLRKRKRTLVVPLGRTSSPAFLRRSLHSSGLAG